MAERAKRKPRANGKPTDTGGQPPGHNGGVPDEVYERYLPKIDVAEIAMNKAKEIFDQKRGEYRALFAAAKEDGANIDALKDARMLHKLDAATVHTNYTDTGRILRLMNSPLATQLHLFEEPDSPIPASPFLAGQQAGREGVDAEENPHVPGTPVFMQWAEGWESGQEILRQGFKERGASLQ